METRPNNNGSAILLTTVLMLMSMLVVTIIAGDLVRNGLIMVRVQNFSTQAYFAAEAGAEELLFFYLQDGDKREDLNNCDTSASPQCIVKWGTTLQCHTLSSGNCSSPNAFNELSNGTRFRMVKASSSPDIFLAEGFYGESYNNNVTKRIIELEF